MLLQRHWQETERQISEPELGDLRFRKLLGRADWERLPEAVKRRFSKRLAGGATAIYTGRVTDVRMTRLGRVLAQVLRFMGAPLPIFDHADVPTVVVVTEDVKTGGQIWTRMYANRVGFPQVIHSAKRFSGPTGLEEHVGFGVSMMLAITACERGLTFHSAGYRFLGLTLPRWLSPGELTVKHLATDAERFVFEMTLQHPLAGELIHQAAEYGDAT
jgi:hypothetical protein